MNRRKSVRVLPLMAVTLLLLLVAVISPSQAESMEQAARVTVSQDASFCEGDLLLELSCPKGVPIFYTLDGSIPTLDSMLYEGPVILPASEQVQSCVLRACTYDEDTGSWGELFTRTYFYAEQMETLQKRFSTYIVCLTSDPYNLYDYEHGIMVEGKIRDEYRTGEEYISGKLTQPANFTQEGREWERDAWVEILSPDGERLVSQNAGIRIFGHASRQYYYKSFKLYARDEYGESAFSYPFFADNASGKGDKVQDSYERLVVRAHGFDKSVTLFREELFQRLCSQIEDIDTKSVAAASVWLNGAYYNFEWLQEVYDDRYMEENYGLMQPGDSYRNVKLRDDKIRKDVDADEDDFQAYADYEHLAACAEQDLTDDRNFEEFQKQIDVESMIRYFAVETYIGNWDWPLNNVKLYRYYSSNGVYGDGRQDGRWRYLYYDMEAGFNIFNEPEEEWLSIQTVMEKSPLFGAVMKRPDMQEKFADYIEHCIHDYFTEEKVRAAIRQLQKERDQELSESFAYKQSIDETYTMDMEEVEQNLETIYEFVEKRPEMMRQEVESLFGIRIE